MHQGDWPRAGSSEERHHTSPACGAIKLPDIRRWPSSESGVAVGFRSWEEVQDIPRARGFTVTGKKRHHLISKTRVKGDSVGVFDSVSRAGWGGWMGAWGRWLGFWLSSFIQSSRLDVHSLEVHHGYVGQFSL